MTPEFEFTPDARLLHDSQKEIRVIEWDGSISYTTRGELYIRTGTSQNRCGSCHAVYPFDEIQPGVWTFIKSHVCKPEAL